MGTIATAGTTAIMAGAETATGRIVTMTAIETADAGVKRLT
jgi:hypothetical protein